MRRTLGLILLAGGVCVAVVGLIDAGAAWWSQYCAGLEVTTSGEPSFSVALPQGFEARLTIPRLASSVYLVKVNRYRDFRRGPGYIAGSARPGSAGNTIVAGHRDLHFRMLKDLKVGDKIVIESPNGRFVYRVASLDIVGARDSKVLQAVYPSQLTLVTCYPFFYVGPAPKRFIVRAYPVEQL